MISNPEVSLTLPVLLDQAQAAEYLGKSEAWFERSRWENSGPKYVKVGRSIRYRASDLLDYLNRREVETGAA